MDFILHGYYVNNPTWFYLSFLLIVSVYFKFNRLWSVRNLDLALLLLTGPGLLIVPHQRALGYGWLFLTSGLLLIRVLMDQMLTRRPRHDQNMNSAGLAFLCAMTFALLMTKMMTEPPPDSTVESVRRANQLLLGEKAAPVKTPSEDEGPTSILPTEFEVIAARSIAILAHLAVILGLVMVGRRVFGDHEAGLAMATLYMLLPCTAYDVGKVHHVFPAALIVWAIWGYTRPFISGALLGLACGTLFFPIFLLPLWAAFYGRRGAISFGLAVGCALSIMAGGVFLTSADTHAVWREVFGYIEWSELQFRVTDSASRGFWSDHESAYRIPVFVGYLVMLAALTIWPRSKSLAHLISYSAAIIIGTQFWYTQQGGVYVLWYLPILLLVVFRPALVQQFSPEGQTVQTSVTQKPMRLQRRAEMPSGSIRTSSYIR